LGPTAEWNYFNPTEIILSFCRAYKGDKINVDTVLSMYQLEKENEPLCFEFELSRAQVKINISIW
jgi:hypothetical protein